MTAYVVLIGLANLSLTAQSEPTLRELAIQHGSSGAIINVCGPQPYLPDLVERADLIVEGIVKTRATYLTADERDIYTDYDIAIRQVLFQRGVLASSRPGAAIPVIFKSHGGSVVIDGLKIDVDIEVNGVRMTLDEDDHVYLFAERDISDGKWLINPLGVFRVSGIDVVTRTRSATCPRSYQ